MNKVASVTIISVFILSTLLVGYLPVTTTQAATTSPQTYIVPVEPPYIFAVVVTGVNMGNPTSTGVIGTYLNETLNATELSVSIVNVSTGQTFASFTGRVIASKYYTGQYDAYYSPAAQAIVMVFDINATSPTTFPMSIVIGDVLQATGISLINLTYPYLIDTMGNEVYNYEYATVITANAIANSSGLSLSGWKYYPILNSPTYLVKNNNELSVTVQPTEVYSPSATTGVPAPAASSILLAPISIVKIYNPALGDRPLGWGRSLINITMYNPLEGQTSAYTFQLTYDTPAPITVNFLKFASVYSADQLALQKPALGMYNFTGSLTESPNPLSYTIVVFTMNSSQVGITVGYRQSTYNTVVSTKQVQVLNLHGNSYSVDAFAITLTPSKNQNYLVYQVGVISIAGNLPPVPVYGIYYNSSLMNVTLGSNMYPMFWFTGRLTQIQATLPVNSSFTLKPIPVVVNPTVSEYEEVPVSAFRPIGGQDEYSGYLFTTPYGTNNTISGNAYVTGNMSIYLNSTAKAFMGNVTLVGLGNYVAEDLNLSATNTTDQYLATGQFVVNQLSYVGAILTPAYPYLNGTSFTYVIFNISGEGVFNSQKTSNVYSLQYAGIWIHYFSTTMNLVRGLLYGVSNYAIYGGWNYAAFSTIYGFYFNTATSTIATGPISPTYLFFPVATLIPPTYGLLYEVMVNLGLWNNNTITYVRGYAVGPNIPTDNYGYFDAVIIPPSLKVSSVYPSSFTCNSSINIQFYSPDDMLTPGDVEGYTVSLPNASVPWFYSAYLTGPWFNYNHVPGLLLGSLAEQQAAREGFFIGSITTNNISSPFLGSTIVNVTLPNLLSPYPVTIAPSPINWLIDSYYEFSSFTEQPTVHAGIAVDVLLSNGEPLVRTPIWLAGTVMGGAYFSYYLPDILPTTQPGTDIGTGIYNLTVYMRYQLDNGTGANGLPISPGVYVGPPNTMIVILPPNQFVGSKISLYFASGDYAVRYFFPYGYNLSATITVPNATLTLRAPSFVPLYQFSVPLQVIEPYYAAPYPAQLQIGTNNVTLLANTYNFFGVTPRPFAVGVGKFMNVTIRFTNGTTERIYLAGNNVTTLFQGGTLNENGSCTGAYNATISISGLEALLHLTKLIQLNDSVLTIAYYDNITHSTATVKIKFGGVSVISPIQMEPASIFYILTAKYVNATAGLPVTLAQSVVAQPFVSLNDTFLAKAQAGVVAHLYVTNVTIIDHYGNKYVVYYNFTNGSTDIMVNGVVKYAYKGNLLPTIPETAPNTGIFNGSPITLVINMPGTIYNNGTVFNGTLAVEFGNIIVTLGPATNFVLPYFSFNENLFGFGSTMYVTVQDPISGYTTTVRTYIGPYYLAPIRMAPVNITVPMPANASDELEYEDNQSIVLSPTSQYIVVHLTSTINYTYVFYIASVVQLGEDNPEGPAVLLNFQTVVPVPVIGPGIVAQVPVQFSQIAALGSGYYTITMFAVPFAGGPVISLYPAKLVFTNVYVNTTMG